MTSPLADCTAHLAELEARALPGGGLPAFPGGEFCPAATAWALLALPPSARPVLRARARLLRALAPDGGLPAAPSLPTAIWPSAPALLALLASAPQGARPPASASATDLAMDFAAGPAIDFTTGSATGSAAGKNALAALTHFLLTSCGRGVPRDASASVSHDSTLRGWAWTSGTHSWVEPTALGLLALAAAGQGGHPRLAEARALLLDRQLPGGGWNYGNVRVFDAVLEPNLLCTGLALCALAPGVMAGPRPRARVRGSLEYLQRGLGETRAPLSLAWGLLGLGAWGRGGQRAARQRLLGSLRQDYGPGSVLGPVDTETLALACLALGNENGLPAALRRRIRPKAGSHDA